LLDEVFVVLLGELVTLLFFEVYVVCPHGRGVGAKIAGIRRGQGKVNTDLVVLQSNQREVQASRFLLKKKIRGK
jgi:hypothetical protein